MLDSFTRSLAPWGCIITMAGANHTIALRSGCYLNVCLQLRAMVANLSTPIDATEHPFVTFNVSTWYLSVLRGPLCDLSTVFERSAGGPIGLNALAGGPDGAPSRSLPLVSLLPAVNRRHGRFPWLAGSRH